MKNPLAIVLACLVFACASAHPSPDGDNPASSETKTTNQYGVYSFLIGEWEVRAGEGGPIIGVTRVRWGPNQAYIWYSQSLLFDGREQPHLEGILVWNGVHKNLDMLLSMDLKSGRVQEQGTMSVGADGVLVRDITAVFSAGARPIGMETVGPEGAATRYRETYQQIGPDKIVTSATRQVGDQWVPTFPGSDHLVMLRRGK